jgi:hypothetical protein
MSDEVHPIDSPEAAESVPQRFGPRSFLKKVFIGPCGLRAGWKVLIFFLMIIAIGFCLRPLGKLSGKIDPKLPVPPGLMLFREFLRGVTVLIATGIMARFIDHRAWGYFGTPLRNAFRSSFWIGAAIGLGVLALQLEIMHLCGWFDYGTMQPLAVPPSPTACCGHLCFSAFASTRPREHPQARWRSLCPGD